MRQVSTELLLEEMFRKFLLQQKIVPLAQPVSREQAQSPKNAKVPTQNSMQIKTQLQQEHIELDYSPFLSPLTFQHTFPQNQSKANSLPASLFNTPTLKPQLMNHLGSNLVRENLSHHGAPKSLQNSHERSSHQVPKPYFEDSYQRFR